MAFGLTELLGIGGLAANALTSGISALSQKRANDTNYQLNKEYLDFAKYQYENDLRYNSASEQVKRLKMAGINPQLAMMQGQMGTAATASSPGSPLPMQGIDLSQSSLGSSFGDFASLLINKDLASSNINKTNKEAENIGLHNQTFMQDFLSKLGLNKSQKKLNYMLRDLYGQQLEYDKQAMGDKLWQQKWQAELTRASAESQLLTNNYIPQQMQANISNTLAQASMAYNMGLASLKQAHAAVMQATAQTHAFDAQFGGDPAERSKFFNASLKLLIQRKNESLSNEYRNSHIPWGFSLPFGAGFNSQSNLGYRRLTGDYGTRR